jgi:DnaJ-class molecular chaperone
MGCHKEIDMGPTGCTDCHVKRTTKILASSEESTKKPVKEATKVGPEMLILNSLEQRYEPVTFSHGIHTEMTENCATCHHHSPAGQTPACRECHGAPFDPKNLNMPGLKGAYHLQCMGCHREMGGGPMGCDECHAKKTSSTKEMKKK